MAAPLKFSKTHEWVREESGGTVTVGISEYAQSQLGDVIYPELPSVGQKLESGARLGVIESVKAASDLYSPVAGEVVEVNQDLKEHPEYINDDPYGKGWVLKLKSVTANSSLLDQAMYDDFIKGQA